MGKIKNKWDGLDKGIQKWATRVGAIVTIIGAVAGCGSWLIHQLDNAVAARLEDQTSQIQEEVQAISKEMEENKKQSDLQLTRLELMTLIESDPENVVGIERLAKTYFSPPLNGNSYMTAYYTKWAKKYGGDLSLVLR